jgi:hypothetical protein
MGGGRSGARTRRHGGAAPLAAAHGTAAGELGINEGRTTLAAPTFSRYLCQRHHRAAMYRAFLARNASNSSW